MSVSVDIEGFKDPTPEYKAMAAAYRACEEAGVPIPDELNRFFDWGEPRDDGTLVSLEEAMTGKGVAYGDGILIDLSKLPEGVTRIRVSMG
jgi:hypothetical protein